jgi:cell division protein FtsQ
MSGTLDRRLLAEPAFAAVTLAPSVPTVLLRGERARSRAFFSRARWERPPPRGLGVALAAGLLALVVAVGATRGGQYRAFVASEGGIGDFLARGLGLGVEVVTLSGQSRLTVPEILKLAGVTPKDSVPFFDVEAARESLEKAPLIKRASVRKLYPNRLVIDIVERTPAALWQRDGEVRTIAADGAVIDELRNSRLTNLPFVVGDGANERLGEFDALVAASAEIGPKIEAGVLVGGRRWNFKMKSGLDVKLPEDDPLDAVATLVRLQRQSRLLDRDILWLDLRTPGRVFARLSAEAAAAREQRLAGRPKKGAAR